MTRFSRAYAESLAKVQDDRRRKEFEQTVGRRERSTSGGVDGVALERQSAADPSPGQSRIAGVGTGPLTKYGNVRTDGYASKREGNRAAELRLLEQAGLIRNLREQVVYLLIPKQDGERACSYVADFVYQEWIPVQQECTADIVEDCKGARTEVYRIKRKLMKFVHGITIKET